MKKTNDSSINIEASRREFITKSALLGLGAVSLSALGGCAPKAKDDKAEQPSGGTGLGDDIAWDKEFEVVILGSGGASWAALSAIDAGATSVCIVEKAAMFGGSSSFSGGAHWIPCNYVQEENGIEDTRDQALVNIATLAEGKSSTELQEAFVDNCGAFVKWSHDTFGFEWEFLSLPPTNQEWISSYYGHDWPGAVKGRTLQVNAVKSTENISGETIERPLYGAGVEFVLVQRLCEERGVDIMLETEAKKIYRNSEGVVVGVLVEEANGTELRIGASKGVLVGTGGFDNNEKMRNGFLRVPFYATLVLNTCTGDGHRMGMEIGANLVNMGSSYGHLAYLPEGIREDGVIPSTAGEGTASWDMGTTRGMPGAVVVNKKGRRFMNESAFYAPASRSFEGYDSGIYENPNVPGFFIGDATFAEHYALPGAGYDVGVVPDCVTVADTLEELAEKLGIIDSAALVAEIEEFNKNAEMGVDPVFHRGEKMLEQTQNGDTTGTREELVNNCLWSVKTPPFYGCAIYPASAGTSGGLEINGKAQVIDVHGEVVPHLFACGNAAGSPFGPAYPGGGSPVASSCTMGYVAGRSMMETEAD